MKDNGLQVLSREQQERLFSAVRAQLLRRESWGDEPLFKFAARYDPGFTSEVFLRNPSLMCYYTEAAWLSFSKSGRERDALDLLRRKLNSIDEGEVCMALAFIGTNKLAFASEEVYVRTKAVRWMIRLQALRAMDQLDDPRTAETIRRHLVDIRRHRMGARILGPESAFAALSSSLDLRTSLVDAIVRRNVEGGKSTLETILANSSEPQYPIRVIAGQGLMRIDRQSGIAGIRRLLRSRSEADVLVGALVAEVSLAKEVLEELNLAAKAVRCEGVRHQILQAVETLQGDIENQEPPAVEEHP